MDKMTLKITGARAKRFTGAFLGRALPNWAALETIEIRLYKTARGRYLCYTVDHPEWEGIRPVYKLHVCASEAEVIEFFGQGDLAHALYEDAGIENAEDLE